MKILAITPNYPHPGFPYSGVFSEKCVRALGELCEEVEVLAPRPYVPSFLAFRRRWKRYSRIAGFEKRDGISVHRPPVPQIPGVGGAFWYDLGAYLFCRNRARKLHREKHFDAIVSFDLLGAGGLAWRTGKDLGLPSCGWAFGSDVRVSGASSNGVSVARAVRNLDLVFYQSAELLRLAAQLINEGPETLSSAKHVVLPHGIPVPRSLPGPIQRKIIRNKWGVSEDQPVVLCLGRITRQKGVTELLDAASYALSVNSGLIFILVGSLAAFDESEIMRRRVEADAALKRRVRILPACKPDEIWDVLCGADIFAFTSHNEGMPNSLLEAMAAGLPSVAFAIPAVEELDGGTSSLITVAPFDSRQFGREILLLAGSPEKREEKGARGRRRVLEKFHLAKNMALAVEKIALLVHRGAA
jgi:glycosyltransferase involved in cell wall biosynthesis